MEKRILLLDGAMGSMIYTYEPTEEDYRGQRFANHPVPLKNCTEALLFSKPDMIREIHKAYLEAGADIIETDSFNSNRLSMGEFHLDHLVARTRIQRLEQEIEQARQRIVAIDTLLADPKLYARDPKKAGELARLRKNAGLGLGLAEEDWLKANEALERLQTSGSR